MAFPRLAPSACAEGWSVMASPCLARSASAGVSRIKRALTTARPRSSTPVIGQRPRDPKRLMEVANDHRRDIAEHSPACRRPATACSAAGRLRPSPPPRWRCRSHKPSRGLPTVRLGAKRVRTTPEGMVTHRGSTYRCHPSPAHASPTPPQREGEGKRGSRPAPARESDDGAADERRPGPRTGRRSAARAADQPQDRRVQGDSHSHGKDGDRARVPVHVMRREPDSPGNAATERTGTPISR